MSFFEILLSNNIFCFFSFFLSGLDSTLLVYGQSGSGKSFTIGSQNFKLLFYVVVFYLSKCESCKDVHKQSSREKGDEGGGFELAETFKNC